MGEDDAVALLEYLSYSVFRSAWEIWVAIYENSAAVLSVSVHQITLDHITGVMQSHRQTGLVEENEGLFDGITLPTWKLAGESPLLPDGMQQFVPPATITQMTA